jgi:hypothetical protein
VRLDGLKVVGLFGWPKTIPPRATVTPSSSSMSGRRKSSAGRCCRSYRGDSTDLGRTIWNVFAATSAEVLPPLFNPLEVAIDVEARKGKGDGRLSHEDGRRANPQSRHWAEHCARIDLPDGIEYSIAETAVTKAAGPIPIAFESSYGQLGHIHLNNQGIVRA